MSSLRCVDYLEKVLRVGNHQKVVEETARKIEQCINRTAYDCIAFQGMSGALVAPAVAVMLNKPCAPVRKGEYSHSEHTIELISKFNKYIIVDDLISCGKTVRAILKAGDKHGMECTAIVLYNESEFATTMGRECLVNQFRVDEDPEKIGSKLIDIYCVGWLTDYVPRP